MKLPRLRGEVLPGAPLARLTSVRVGGPADVLVRPADAEDLRVLLAACAEQRIPVHVLGGGANTVIADGGIAGVTVRLPPAPEEADPGAGIFTLPAGAPIARVTALMKAHGLTGAEFLAGIPGTMGGAVAMNAGTKNGEAARVIEAVEVATAAGVRFLDRAELGFRYRGCDLPAGGVVTRVRIRLRRPESEVELAASRAAIDADLAYRRRTQPLSVPSSGSVFQNPPGDFAGRLIEACGLKGRRQGGAQIAEVHANWIVNRGDATAADVRFLMELAHAEVLARHGVRLRPEVKLVGRWDPWPG